MSRPAALTAIVGAERLFDGEAWHEGAALLVADGIVTGIVPEDAIPAEAGRQRLEGGLIVPGLVDLQVNGGGGVQFNDAPDLEAIRTILAAHAAAGVTALLPTLITDSPAITARALAAGAEAARLELPGFLGLHLEGPHLALSRKGAHDPALIRPMEPADRDALIAARPSLPHLIVTVAAETVPPEQIAALAAAGITVSIGHSDAGYTMVEAAASAGASMVTHLFNAQSQMLNREPGVVGAALGLGSLWAGIIADGIHVHPAALDVAMRAKRGPGRVFLVSDAMAPAGTDIKSFTLNGRTITRADGALRLADGTLAGADLTLIEAVRFVHRRLALPLEEALRMASLYPAQAIGASARHGHLRRGARADFVHLSSDLVPLSTHIAGVPMVPRP
ncbi:N-acetylglucosamine-6-phosphate deacetylase [Devosia enhydra]|uniref:N-acetylglucosamine-6-phosphate deacetylase n=1 Tax=Devosia enhydra TaxID=665118 RepID=A0A1K2I266_9HYPH|nr:N-acetylglucosamine-6-phosphate deacetylase [Devosia enhydra]SFZ86477.1 N-acetylglucosamine-6-phosphate deacetylase [Devosia enhydra]